VCLAVVVVLFLLFCGACGVCFILFFIFRLFSVGHRPLGAVHLCGVENAMAHPLVLVIAEYGTQRGCDPREAHFEGVE
jgi:hypothetical protein